MTALGFLLIVLGAMPILAGVTWLVREDAQAFVLALALTAIGFVGIGAVVIGIGLVAS